MALFEAGQQTTLYPRGELYVLDMAVEKRSKICLLKRCVECHPREGLDATDFPEEDLLTHMQSGQPNARSDKKRARTPGVHHIDAMHQSAQSSKGRDVPFNPGGEDARVTTWGSGGDSSFMWYHVQRQIWQKFGMCLKRACVLTPAWWRLQAVIVKPCVLNKYQPLVADGPFNSTTTTYPAIWQTVWRVWWWRDTCVLSMASCVLFKCMLVSGCSSDRLDGMWRNVSGKLDATSCTRSAPRYAGYNQCRALGAVVRASERRAEDLALLSGDLANFHHVCLVNAVMSRVDFSLDHGSGLLKETYWQIAACLQPAVVQYSAVAQASSCARRIVRVCG
jgi:hypothetical protein